MKTAVAVAALALGFFGSSMARAESTTAANPESSPAATAPAGAAPSAATTMEPPAAAPRHRTLWPWVIMGTGVALVVTAGVLQIVAVKEDDKREADEVKLTGLPVNTPASDPQKKALLDSSAQHDKSATNTRTASLIVGTVGFLAIAGAVVLWFVEGGSSTPEPPPSAKPKLKPTFTPTLTPSYAGATFGATF